MRFTLFPQQNEGVELLAEMAQQLGEAVRILGELLGAPVQDVQRLSGSLHELDAATANLQFALLTRMRTSLISPLPREDLYALAAHLTGVMTSLDAAGHLILLHRLTHLSRRPAEQLEVISLQVDSTTRAMRRLTTLDELEDYWIEVHRLSRRAESTHRKHLAELLAEHAPTGFERHRFLADQLVGTTRLLRDMASHVGQIIVRES
ncbi:nuclease PIN [Tersicoccus solisilvae]|uniref:nuclease PIN n=1 Tax=Tersicoccus solisilvae TaxID=1882339 RepID=UPI001666DD84|nr:nuclease PIN [Tersicoccus solisilvae]